VRAGHVPHMITLLVSLSNNPGSFAGRGRWNRRWTDDDGERGVLRRDDTVVRTPRALNPIVMCYVSDSIGPKPGWENAICLEDYFAGWETTQSPSISCPLWLRSYLATSEGQLGLGAQERKEAVPHRAAPRKRTLDEGTTAPRPLRSRDLPYLLLPGHLTDIHRTRQ
jgi:hypothetical protein